MPRLPQAKCPQASDRYLPVETKGSIRTVVFRPETTVRLPLPRRRDTAKSDLDCCSQTATDSRGRFHVIPSAWDQVRGFRKDRHNRRLGRCRFSWFPILALRQKVIKIGPVAVLCRVRNEVGSDVALPRDNTELLSCHIKPNPVPGESTPERVSEALVHQDTCGIPV